jgi:integrase
MACITKKKYRDKERGITREALVIDFYDQNGKRRIKTLPDGISKRDARKILREVESEVERGAYLPKTGIPTFAKVADDWLKYKKPNIRHNSYIFYKGHIENHLVPFFGATKINRISFNSVERFMSHAATKGVKPPTLKKILVTLGGILKYAVRKKLCEYNPIREIEKPKVTRKRQVDFLKPPEIRALVENAKNQKFKTLFTLAVMSGMRRGEVLGLKWTDIDWFNCQVHVKRTYNHRRFYEPKSETSGRAIDLGPTVMAELKKWKLACPPNELGLVFPNEAGKPMDASHLISRQFRPTLRRAGLRLIRFHDLRHTFASLLIDRGEHPKYIQSQMGHSSINITMDVYGHLMETVNKDAAMRLDEAVFGKSSDLLETKEQK